MVATYDIKTDYKVVGNNPIRHDGLDKVTGRAIYGGDVKVPGLIWGDVVRSPHAHARIKSTDTSAAEAQDGVVAVLTQPAFPPTQQLPLRPAQGDVDLRRGQANIMAHDKVHYKGHVVAAVAATDRNTAQEAANKIKVEYEVLTPVSDVDAAMADNAPIILESLVGDHLGEDVPNTNIARSFRHASGDLEQALAKSEPLIQRTLSLSMVHQVYIAPHHPPTLSPTHANLTTSAPSPKSHPTRPRTRQV